MELTSILTLMLLPPLAPLLGVLVALILRLFPANSLAAKLSFPMIILSLLALWVFSTPAFSDWMGQRLKQPPVAQGEAAQAVVVLGAGRYRDSRTGEERLSAAALERVVWAAQKAPRKLPMLVSGGRVFAQEQLAEADMMAELLQEALSRPVTWRESCSRTTAENAVNSAKMLRDGGVERIVLVTHWWHMPRAAKAFARAGLQVEPLPVGSADERLPRAQSGLLRWLPSAAAMLRAQLYWREKLASLWYAWRPMPEVRRC